MLAAGDILCLYTDGITEGRNAAKDEFGDERLASVLRHAAGLTAGEIRDKIFQDVIAFTSCAEQGDDMTLVVIKRNA